MNWQTSLTILTIFSMTLSAAKEIFDNKKTKDSLEKENESLKKEIKELKSKKCSSSES